MHFRLRSISMFFSLEPTSRYLISIALELLMEMTPRRCSLLKTLLVLLDRLAAISSMEFPASRDSTSWFSSAWLHRLFAITGLGICESWYSPSESFSIAKRKASWISTDKNLDFWSANNLFFDSELFRQISTGLTPVLHLTRWKLHILWHFRSLVDGSDKVQNEEAYRVFTLDPIKVQIFEIN